MQADTRVQINTTKENAPIKRFKSGAISATVWENHATNKAGEQTSFYTVSLDRAYKDATGVWQNATSYRTSDLPRAQLVLNKAYEWIALEN